MSASIAEGIAEVLRRHQLCVAWEDADGAGITCMCGLDIPLEKERGEIDMEALAAHQAEVLAANGYGKLEDAWDEGWAHYRKYYSPAYVEFGTNPYRRPE